MVFRTYHDLNHWTWHCSGCLSYPQVLPDTIASSLTYTLVHSCFRCLLSISVAALFSLNVAFLRSPFLTLPCQPFLHSCLLVSLMLSILPALILLVCFNLIPKGCQNKIRKAGTFSILFTMYSWYLEQHLAYSMCSINVIALSWEETNKLLSWQKWRIQTAL